jgi:hypothetical protein
MRERKSCQDGKNWKWNPSRTTGAFGRESSGRLNRIDASWELETDGFSMSTCFPARMALIVHSKWRLLARGM